MESLLAEGVEPNRILYVPFDELPAMRGIHEPVLAISRWFEEELAGKTFNELARDGKVAYLFFDEVQNLDAWAPQIKNLVDNHTVRLLVTGSSSLRIEAGRDSLAGRITTIDLGPLLLREIAQLRFGHCEPPRWATTAWIPLPSPSSGSMPLPAPSRRLRFVASRFRRFPSGEPIPSPSRNRTPLGTNWPIT